MRAALDERAVPVPGQPLYGFLEADGLAQVPVPVPGVQYPRVEQVAGDRGVERYVRRGGLDPREYLQQLVADLRHVRGV